MDKKIFSRAKIHINSKTNDMHLTIDGKIDELRIWNDARTVTEIKSNIFKELDGNEANLTAYYKMSDGSGTSLTDNSSNSYTGTLTNKEDYF